jgi:leucyl-tRNA synthetase
LPEAAGKPSEHQEISPAVRALRRKTHQTIAKVTSDFEQLHLNTSVAALMELFNVISDFRVTETDDPVELFAMREAIETLIVMLAPFSPHVAEEMWEALGHEGGLLHSAAWPQADAELARKEQLEIPVQVNGKLRSKILVTPDATEDDLRTAALQDEKILAITGDRQVVKVIVVPQRLVNIVVR